MKKPGRPTKNQQQEVKRLINANFETLAVETQGGKKVLPSEFVLPFEVNGNSGKVIVAIEEALEATIELNGQPTGVGYSLSMFDIDQRGLKTIVKMAEALIKGTSDIARLIRAKKTTMTPEEKAMRSAIRALMKLNPGMDKEQAKKALLKMKQA